MGALLVSAQVFVLVTMVAVSAWGWKHIDPETRIRARTGTTGFDYTMSKTTALLWTPLIGLLVVSATIAFEDPSSQEPAAWLGLALMLIFLGAHWYSVRRAAR